MSLIDGSLPGRGQTFYGPTATIDTSNYGGKEWAGVEMEFIDRNPFSNTQPNPRSNRIVKCRFVRNVAGVALLGQKLASIATGTYGAHIDGYCTLIAQTNVFPIDEYLPAAGVRNYDMCWIVTEGPALVLNDLAGAANNNLTIDTIVCALTAVTSQSTTAGRIMPIDTSGTTATTTQMKMVMGMLGRVLTAKTTTQTNVGVLIDIRPRQW